MQCNRQRNTYQNGETYFSKKDKVLRSASSAGIDKRAIIRLAFLPISFA